MIKHSETEARTMMLDDKTLLLSYWYPKFLPYGYGVYAKTTCMIGWWSPTTWYVGPLGAVTFYTENWIIA